MNSIRSASLAALIAITAVSIGQAAQVAKPMPKPIMETYSSWDAMKSAKGWPDVDAAAKLPLMKRLQIATAALTIADRKVRNPDYGFALLLSGPPSREATRLLAKGVLTNEYAFGDKTRSVLRSLATEGMRGCKSCVAAYAEIQYSAGEPENDAVAYKWYRWAALVGNNKGIEATAIALSEGRGTEKNLTEARNWADRLDAPRRAKLYTELAKRVVMGKTPDDIAASGDLLLQAMALNPADSARPAKQLLSLDFPPAMKDQAMAAIRAAGPDVDPNALKMLAVALWKSDNPASLDEAISIFQRLAESGNPDAADYLTKALARSDIDKARKDQIVATLQAAASSGYASAAKALGNVYYYGTGVEASLARAQTYRENAAAQNDPEAQYLLGMMMLQSSDTADKLASGRQWLEKSADGGYPLARAALLKLSSN